jgi:hypothetical protein
MKTKGVEVGEHGYLIFPDRQMVQTPLWSRLKHAAAKAGLVDALAADYRAARSELEAGRAGGWQTVHDEYAAEIRLYRDWVRRLHGEQEVWPWTGGWTEAMVDGYPAEGKGTGTP